jgi:hypothetical protein
MDCPTALKFFDRSFSMKFLRLLVLLSAMVFGTSIFAQQSTPSAPTSTVNWLFAICSDRAVVNLNGTMQSGYDLYVQFFREAGATGAQLSNLIRVPVDGTYNTSQVVTFPAGTTIALGQFGSMRLSIARENNAESNIFTRVIDEVFDTCIEPTGTTNTSSGTGAQPQQATTALIDPVTGQVVQAVAGQPIRSSGILKPGGGFLNAVFAVPQEQIVQIGVRPSQNTREIGRVSDIGLIFAECDQFPGADPGRLYDTDPITVYWSWFAKTAAQVRDHLNKVQYEVFFNTPIYPAQTFPNVNVSPIVRREDGNFYVFYSVNLGGNFRPGDYSVNYRVTWSATHFDGFGNFGPDTETPEQRGSCSWTIEPNPYGVAVNYTNPVFFAAQSR